GLGQLAAAIGLHPGVERDAGARMRPALLDRVQQLVVEPGAPQPDLVAVVGGRCGERAAHRPRAEDGDRIGASAHADFVPSCAASWRSSTSWILRTLGRERPPSKSEATQWSRQTLACSIPRVRAPKQAIWASLDLRA